MTRRANAPTAQPVRAVVPFDAAAAGKALSKAVEERRPQIAALLGVELESERGKAILDRFVTVALHAATSRPDLLRATRESLVEAIRDAAMLGLEPVGATGDGSIVVYREKRTGPDGRDEYVDVARFQPMYRGLLKLARRSDQVASIDAHVVYQHDTIEIDLGSVPEVRHLPALADRGKAIGAYAVAELRNGSRYVDWMTHSDIEAVRRVSRAKDNGPWVGFWSEMARKTVLRRLMKRLPLETLAEHAMRIESEAEELAVPPALAAPSDARRRLLARVSRSSETDQDGEGGSDQDGAGDQDKGGADSQGGEKQNGAPRGSGEAEGAICGATSDPALGPVDVCSLAPEHEEPHKAVSADGEVLSTWPK